MARRFEGGKLVAATHNPGKIREFGELLAAYDVEVISAGDLGLPEPEETGLTFEANAEIKALAAATASGLPALADDSGYVVEALDGAPGIYSARWAGPSKDFKVAMEKVEEELQAKGATTPESRRSSFVSALTLAWPDGHMETFLGVVEGFSVWPARGEKGFGYDPMFQPEGYDRTFGEMSSEEKHGFVDGKGLSHRARAFILLKKACFD